MWWLNCHSKSGEQKVAMIMVHMYGPVPARSTNIAPDIDTLHLKDIRRGMVRNE
jgi:hypothetical protein